MGLRAPEAHPHPKMYRAPPDCKRVLFKVLPKMFAVQWHQLLGGTVLFHVNLCINNCPCIFMFHVEYIAEAESAKKRLQDEREVGELS